MGREANWDSLKREDRTEEGSFRERPARPLFLRELAEVFDGFFNEKQHFDDGEEFHGLGLHLLVDHTREEFNTSVP